MLTTIDGGIRVKTTQHCHVDVMRMLNGNWRLVETDLRVGTYNRGWCYARTATCSSPLLVALSAALLWSGSPDTEPRWWVKALDSSGRRRPDGSVESETVDDF
jgi:hypothetical protein